MLKPPDLKACFSCLLGVATADMVQRGCERNVITYSSLISACEKAGRCELALQLFERMHKEGCMPNVVTYNSLIAACSHGGCAWQSVSQSVGRSVGCHLDWRDCDRL
jgi:pentatricopeptide repeat domain-containing protein 1